MRADQAALASDGRGGAADAGGWPSSSPPRRTGYAALVVLLAGTGLRISEALGLQVGDVNFLSRKMQVARQRDPRTNQFVPTKTRSSVRSVPLGQVVVDALAAHLAKYPAADDGSIFTNEHGRPLTYELWRSCGRRPARHSRRTICAITRRRR